jgi:hypothetical protein
MMAKFEIFYSSSGSSSEEVPPVSEIDGGSDGDGGTGGKV